MSARAFTRLFGLCVLFLTFGIAPASALEIPNRPTGRVVDGAELLSPSAESRLESALLHFEQQTTNQVVVATFPSLEDESLEDFSIRLAERWKIGQADKNNGVILVIFRDERLIRIEVGYGLEGVLPDAHAGTIIQNEIIPLFRAGDFESGIFRGVQAILLSIEGEYTAPAQRAQQGPFGSRPLTPEELESFRRQGMILGLLILIAAGGIFILDIFRYRAFLRDRRDYRDRYTFWGWFFRFALLLAVLSCVFRMLFYMMLFSRGGYGGYRRGGSMGGFSGGGGSFGGGGASGRW